MKNILIFFILITLAFSDIPTSNILYTPIYKATLKGNDFYYVKAYTDYK